MKPMIAEAFESMEIKLFGELERNYRDQTRVEFYAMARRNLLITAALARLHGKAYVKRVQASMVAVRSYYYRNEPV